MRPDVVTELIEILRRSGYPGYEETGINSTAAVGQRMQELCISKYGRTRFTPHAVQAAIADAHRASLRGPSLIQDKSATPAEPASSIEELQNTLRPMQIVGERSTSSQTAAHEEYASVFARFQSIDIQTGSTMLNQFRPQYIGMAHPFTLPSAVGGCDIPGQEQWRRPEFSPQNLPPNLSLPSEWWEGLPDEQQGTAEYVRIFDITRGLSQRIEGQYRRHWGFIPGLWNLYFRQETVDRDQPVHRSQMCRLDIGHIVCEHE